MRLLLILATLLVTHQCLRAQVPDTLSFQGYLTNPLGEPLDTSVVIFISLYQAGGLVWEDKFATQVDSGVFEIGIGTSESLAGVPFNEPTEVEIKVGNNPVMTPRTPLRSAPYALGLRGIKVIPPESTSDAPNLLGGHNNNSSSGKGGTIGGGGSASVKNAVSGDYGTVGGGRDNSAGDHSFVGGGKSNTADTKWSVVAGGAENSTSGNTATIGGGGFNSASEGSTVAGGGFNTASGRFSTIGGGSFHRALAVYATIAGGGPADTTSLGIDSTRNVIYDSWGTIGGGGGNRVGTDDISHQNGGTVAGGIANTASSFNTTVSGGFFNTASGSNATVGGGQQNTASNDNATVAGGFGNRASGQWSSVGGGLGNQATQQYATVPGGDKNAARGLNSFAAGTGAKANHHYSFVWGDGDGISPFDSTFTSDTKQFIISAANGVGINTSNPQSSLHVVGTFRIGTEQFIDEGTDLISLDATFRPKSHDTYDLGTSSFKWQDIYATNNVIQTSDRRLKQDISNLEYGLPEILLLRPVSYRWKSDPTDRRLGLIAQEVEEVIPETVEIPGSAEAYYGMTYSELIPVMIRAIQEQQLEINELRTELAVIQKGPIN